MGTLRLLLALSVVFAHAWTPGLVFVGGRNAVQMFYMISGFLISFILLEAKVYRNTRHFYINRLLRLYPVYFLVALLTLILYLLLPNGLINGVAFLEVYERAPLSVDIYLALANVILFGQDWALFSGVLKGQWVFMPDFTISEILIYPGLLVPQAWTLGLELCFYLIAPWVLVQRSRLYTLLALSLAVRGTLVVLGFALKDPWSYRFFPAELSMFLLGAIAHQVLLPWYRQLTGAAFGRFAEWAAIVLIVFTAIYFLIPIAEAIKTIILIACCWALLPAAFVFQNRHSLDAKLGELSYPVYIGHMLVLSTLSALFAEQLNAQPLIYATCGVGASLIFAIMLNAIVERPLAHLRARFRNMHLPHPAS